MPADTLIKCMYEVADLLVKDSCTADELKDVFRKRDAHYFMEVNKEEEYLESGYDIKDSIKLEVRWERAKYQVEIYLPVKLQEKFKSPYFKSRFSSFRQYGPAPRKDNTSTLSWGFDIIPNKVTTFLSAVSSYSDPDQRGVSSIIIYKERV